MRDRFVAETEADLAKGGEHVRVRAGKEFVVRLHSYGVPLGLDDPWFRATASRRLLDIANAYLEMWSKLEYVDVWYSVPQPAGAERISSQRWHRDYNDKHLLKVFLYLVDVDDAMGPFQYVPGSQPGGPYADAWPWEPLGKNYPTEEELEALIPSSSIRAFTAPKGTLIFCNTAGFHRGGFSTTSPRVLATATYSSPASLASLTDAELRARRPARQARRADPLRAPLSTRIEESGAAASRAADLYLDLLKRALTGLLDADDAVLPDVGSPVPFDLNRRSSGRDWPTKGETMIGLARLDNLHSCLVQVIRDGVPGDVIETGVWRGGATIFMRAVLEVYGDTDRAVWVADSFQGLPQPDHEAFPADAGDTLWTYDHLAVSLEQVQENFRKYGLLDDRVRFLPGWFRDTLPGAPIERLAVLRLDGDLYESTMVALGSLYPKLSPGGFVVVDDYALPPCRAAVDDFRSRHRLGEAIEEIDWTGVYWRKDAQRD